MLRLLLLISVAFTSWLGADARKLAQISRSCAQGSFFEVYKPADFGSFHSIMGYQNNVPTIRACARLCQAASGCKCAYYPIVGGTCVWRSDACSTSELYTNNTPVQGPTGLISMCSGSGSTQDASATASTVATWGQCGGSNYTGPKCCGANDQCVEQSVWYAQCIPIANGIPLGWTGRILTC